MRPLLFLVTLATVLHAGEPVSPSILTSTTEDSAWDLTLALYAPLMGLDGDVGVRGLGPLGVDLSFDEVFDHLDGAASGAFEARHGRWSIAADAIWLKLSDSTRPFADARFDFRQEQLTSAVSLGYELYDGETSRLDLVGGCALNHINLDLKLFTPNLPVTERTESGNQTWLDPFVGLRFQQEITACWNVFATGTIGGFGVSSDEYWQVLAGIGWRMTEHTSLALAWRAISVDYQQGGFHYDTISSGPNLGLLIRF